MQQQNFMKHFRKLVFVMGVFSVLALLPELASAQQFSQASPTTPRGGERYGNFSFNPETSNWKSTVDAIPAVEQRIAQLEAQLVNQQVGSLTYVQTDIRRAYFKLVLSQLEANVTVKEAVISSGKLVAVDYPTATVNLLNNIVAEGAALLTN